MFAITRFRSIQVLFHIFHYYLSEEYRSLLTIKLCYKGLLNRDSTVLYIILRLESKSARLLQFLFEIASRQS